MATVQTKAEKVLLAHTFEVGQGKNFGQYRTEYTCDCGDTVVHDGHNRGGLSPLALQVAHQIGALREAEMLSEFEPAGEEHPAVKAAAQALRVEFAQVAPFSIPALARVTVNASRKILLKDAADALERDIFEGHRDEAYVPGLQTPAEAYRDSINFIRERA